MYVINKIGIDSVGGSSRTRKPVLIMGTMAWLSDHAEQNEPVPYPDTSVAHQVHNSFGIQHGHTVVSDTQGSRLCSLGSDT